METLIKSIYAGFMIGLGGTIYLSLENRVVGAILFSFGLLTIINQDFYLYTGKVGYENDIKKLAMIVSGNAIGTFIIAIIIRLSKPNLIIIANNVWQNKLQLDTLAVILLSMLCGIMMYLAVDNFNKNNNMLLIIFPVIIFILCGFEHSIANMFYMLLSGNFSIGCISYLVICIICNGLGAKTFHLLKP